VRNPTAARSAKITITPNEATLITKAAGAKNTARPIPAKSRARTNGSWTIKGATATNAAKTLRAGASRKVPLGAAVWRVARSTGESGRAEKPSIQLYKSVDKSSAQTGDVLTYTLRYENTGNGAALGLTITDVVPKRARYIEDSASGANAEISVDHAHGKTIIRWTILRAVSPGDTGEVTFQAIAK